LEPLVRLFFYLKHFPPQADRFHEGTSKAVHGLAAALVEQGIDVTILCEGPTPASLRSAAGYRIECFLAPHTSPAFGLSPGLRAYIDQQLQPTDLVILNGVFHRSLYALSRRLRQQGMRYLVAPHDVYHRAMFQKNPIVKWLYWWLCEQPLLQAAQAVQTLDPRHQTRLRELGITTPIFALPNGFLYQELDPAMLAATTQGTFQLAAPRLMFYGRLDAHHKGLDLLIQGFMQAALPDCSLTLQGPDEGDRAQLVQMARSAGNAINFLPPNFELAAEAVLSAYDVICLPSRFEGFGLVALEAMLAGRVLLVAETAGIAPYVAACGCGVLIPATVAGVERGIQQLLQCREQWAAMGARGRDYALAHLTWTTVAQQALPRYHQLAVILT
jgi:glycosyltransferase involved in cell wall biosynthesis